jgi:hypothetical protein
MDIDKALAAGRPIGMANTFANTASVAPDPTFLGNMGNAFKGIGGAATGNQAAIDAYTKGIGAESALGALGKTALPFAGAAVTGGLEPSDLYGEPVQTSSKEDKYNPYSRLNLSNDTGLRLVAKGGYIDGYAEGGVIQPTVRSGGIRDLYGSSDNQTEPLSSDGFGLGRLSNLANQQAMTTAKTLGYAEGGLADLELKNPTTPTEQAISPEVSVLNEVAKTKSNENQMNNLGLNSLGANMPTNNYAPGSLATVVNAMKNEPVAPEAAFVQNLTGARTGYAEGGETHMNLDELPSLNVNTGEQGYGDSGRPKEIQNMIRAFGMAGESPNINPGTRVFSRMMSGALRGDPGILGMFQGKGAPSSLILGMAKGGYLDGQGDGMSDSIPATIEGKQPARLADGEFVIPADVVSHLGNGSTKAGSKRLYAMLDKVRHARTGTKKQGKQIKPEKYMPA